MESGLVCSVLAVTAGRVRTGYVAACVLKRKEIENPIAYLHTHYCRNAVESDEQREAIIRF